jgi:hypothetical protein
MTVKEIVKAWLEEHQYDGLASYHCGCQLSDLMPCGGEGCDDCESAKIIVHEEKDSCEFCGESLEDGSLFCMVNEGRGRQAGKGDEMKDGCLECKYFNVDNKDGNFSTCYSYCELGVKTPEAITGKGADLESCDKWRSRIKCDCPFNLLARKKFYGEDQHFSGIDRHFEEGTK